MERHCGSPRGNFWTCIGEKEACLAIDHPWLLPPKITLAYNTNLTGGRIVLPSKALLGAPINNAHRPEERH